MTLRARFAMVRSQTPVVLNGLMQKDWYLFLTNLYQAAIDGAGASQSSEGVVLGASPFVYQAVIRGQAHVTGGTVSAIEFSRDGSTWFNASATAGFVQMDTDDKIRITYSVLPTLTFFPM